MAIAASTLTEAHREWATRPADQRFETLSALRAALYKRRACSAAHDAPITDLHVTAEGTDLIIGNGRRMKPSNWSFGQFAGLVKAPAAFCRSLKAETTAMVLNECIERAPKDAYKIMALRGEEGTTLQAITSTKYGRIWDADVADAAGRIVERSGGKFHNPLAIDITGGGAPKPSGLYASDRDVFIFMVDGGSILEAGPRAHLSRGFFLSNSEVGKATFTLKTFMFNHVCGNHLVWGAQNVNELAIRHSSGGPARFDREAMPILLDYTNSEPDLSGVKLAQQTPIGNLLNSDSKFGSADWIRAFAKKHDFTQGEVETAIEFAYREEGKCHTVWDMVQGLTASAREYEFIDARVDLETRAGKLISVITA